MTIQEARKLLKEWKGSDVIAFYGVHTDGTRNLETVIETLLSAATVVERERCAQVMEFLKPDVNKMTHDLQTTLDAQKIYLDNLHK